MQDIMKKIASVLSMVAIVAVGSYSFGARAAEPTSTKPSNDGQMQQGSNMPSSGQTAPQTNIIVPQGQSMPVGAPAPVAAPRDTLGGLIVLNGLFANGANSTTVTSTDDATFVNTNRANNDLAGLVAVNNLFSSSYGMGGYAASPNYGGESLGGLITLNGLFGSGANNTSFVSHSGNTVINPTMSNSAQSLAGLIAVNNLTSSAGYGAGYGGYAATPNWGGYAAAPAYGGYAATSMGDTLGGLITLNGLFGSGVNTTTIRTDSDDPTIVSSNRMSTSAKDLAGLIAVNNTTSPHF